VKTGEEQQKNNFLKEINIAWGLGFIIISPVIVGTIIGFFLDNLFRTKPIFIIIFLIIGTMGGILSAIVQVKKILKNK